jgi:hypothetical protein
MSYGELKIDTITFTSAGVDTSVSVSGLVQNPTFTGNITTTGTISGDVIKGNTVSGATVTGDTGEFGNLTAVSGVFTTQVSGATVTGNVGLFTTITGGIHTLTSGVFASGTAANPSITFVDDLDTGLFTGAANTVSIGTNGGAVLTVSGTNVGIGTTSPSVLCHLEQDSGSDTELLRLSNPNASGGSFIQVNRTSNIRTASTVYSTALTGSWFTGILRRGGSAISSYSIAQGSDIGSTTPALLIDTNNRVGIGTTSPSTTALLDVDGKIAVVEGSASEPAIHCRNDTDTGLNFVGADRLSLVTAGDNRLFIDSSGNVGISTTSPDPNDWNASARILHVYQNASAGAVVKVESNSATGIFAAASNAVAVGSTTEDPLQFRINGSEVSSFDTSGRLLVGTTTALTNDYWTQGQIQLANTNGAVIQAYTFINTSSSNGSAIELHRSRGTQASPSNPLNNDLLGEINFYGFNSSATTPFQRAAAIRAFVDGTPGGTTTDMPGRLVFSTSADGASSPTARMLIDSNGNVAIGATPEDKRLTIRDTDTNNTILTTASLHIINDDAGSAGRITAVLFGGRNETVDPFAAVGGILSGDSSFEQAGHLAFYTKLNAVAGAPTERMRIDSAGRVLIGTNVTTAGHALIVEGGGEGVCLSRQTSSPGDGDALSYLTFTSSNHTAAASLIARRDGGTWTEGSSQPTRIELSTTPDGSATVSPRLTIDSGGRVQIGTTTPAITTAGYLGLTINSSTAGTLYIQGGGTSGGRLLATSTDFYIGPVQSGGNLIFQRQEGVYESARFDTSGRLLIGTTTYSVSSSELFEVYNAMSMFRNNSDSVSPVYIRNDNSDGTASFVPFLVMQDASANRGGIFMNDSDQVALSGNGGVFILTGGNAPASERARFTTDGYFKASNNATYVGGGSTYHEFTQSVDTACLFVEVSNATYSYPGAFYINAIRSANTAYDFQRMTSGDFSDTEFYFRGDGNAFADGTWTGGGADYAEYFEWSDGNTSSEDRRGISVVLDGNKIREAIAGEEPIGVISGNPSVVGDADGDRWKGKYLRDDFGSYVWEDYEVVNDEGEIVVQQRRKLNPDFNPDTEYVTRENRPEWDCVGLMGKLRIRKGQVTGARWIKMRDVSNNVEEWLVR